MFINGQAVSRGLVLQKISCSLAHDKNIKPFSFKEKFLLTYVPIAMFQLSKKVEELNDRAVCADTDLKADMERWHKMKKKDFKGVFVNMADRQIRFYEQVGFLTLETLYTYKYPYSV